MVTLVALVVTVGVLDSVNPSTVGPALYLATQRRSGRGVGPFTVGVFTISLLGGLILTLGPGYAIMTALPRPGTHTTALVELCVGTACSMVAVGLWLARSPIARRIRRHERRVASSPLILGAGIMAVELPTAFPYFAVITAIVGSDRHVATQIALLVLFNAIFVAPLVAITLARSLMHNRVDPSLVRLRDVIDRHAAAFLTALFALVAVALVAVGAFGLLTA
jgi:cytochrome c biogenesis protein CcdA